MTVSLLPKYNVRNLCILKFTELSCLNFCSVHVAQNKSAFGYDLAVTWYSKALRHLSSLNKDKINEALKWNNCNLIFHK